MSKNPPLNLLEEKENEDKLSNLPDDILVSILSLVDRKDATRSSILSRRWRYMATYLTSIYFYVPQTLLSEYRREDKSHENEKQKYMNWVNQVVTLYRAPFIDDFRICLPFNAEYSDHINNWIEFAVSKRVNKLELDFTTVDIDDLHHYVLPSNCFKDSPCENGISYLTSICLKNVDIRPKVLELLLSRCPLLERLHIERAHKLPYVKIINLSKLKYLELHNCFILYKVEIHDVSLQSFKYSNEDSIVTFVNASVPSLVEACIFWRSYERSLPSFLYNKCFSAQLSKLSVDMIVLTYSDVIIPSFPNVKYLELRLLIRSHQNIFPWIRFAEACPLLHDLKLQLYWPFCRCTKVTSDSADESESESESESEDEPDTEYNLDNLKHWLTIQENTNATLPNLRKLEWSGAFSIHDRYEIPLALYCVKNATVLQKFICDPRALASVFAKPDDIAKIIEGGRRRARRLAMVIPSHIEYIIL